jgi:hypothetical protein
MIEAAVKYLAEGADGGVYHASEAGADARLDLDGDYDDHVVAIEDGRVSGDAFHLDVHGFSLHAAPSAVADFYDDAEIEAVYKPETEALVKRLTGAARTVMFDHTRRGDSADLRAGKTVREPSAVIHCDYTTRSAPQRVRDLLGDEAETLLGRRFAIVNIWRPIGHAASTSMLALCDARGPADADLVAVERRAKDRIGEIYLARFNKRHRWVCFPDMTPDEALAIKTYDSADDGRARLTLHTAFDNPAPPPDARPRESIEARVFCFF